MLAVVPGNSQAFLCAIFFSPALPASHPLPDHPQTNAGVFWFLRVFLHTYRKIASKTNRAPTSFTVATQQTCATARHKKLNTMNDGTVPMDVDSTRTPSRTLPLPFPIPTNPSRS